MALVPAAAGLALLASVEARPRLALLVAGGGLLCAALACAWLLFALHRLAANRARDAALLAQARAELAQARAATEAARRAGSGLVASMGHELRTPMNAILGFTELLAQGGGRSERERTHCLQTIHHSGSQLLALVDDLLEWSRLELGQLKLEQTPCAPHGLVQDALRELAPQARAKGIGLALRQRTPLPERVASDPKRLRQVVVQLLRHALLFSERNGIEVVLACHGSSYAVEVKDSADGIEPAQLESLFDPCATTPVALARRGGGIGLALALSRRLARALGGDLFATSEPGAGTTMHFTFPTGALAGVPLREALPLEAPGPRGQASGHARWRFPAARVLVVDDGAENRELLALVLAEQGLRVDTARNGKEALEKLAAGRYDLVLMDLQMPVMDGLSATRELRRRGHAMPVLALSAQAAAVFGPEALRAGCTAHLGKPIDIELLLARVAQLLGAQPLQAAPAEWAPVQPAPAGEAPVRSRYAGDARLVPIVRKFAARLDYQLELARSALQARDLPELARLAHWLAGSAGTVGYDAFTEPAHELEAAALVGDAAGVERLLQRVTRMAERLQLPDLAPH